MTRLRRVDDVADELADSSMARVVADTSALVSLGTVADRDADPLEPPVDFEPETTERHSILCLHGKDVPTITVNVDDALKERMDDHPEINWSEVTRQAIREKIEKLELLDALTAGSELTEDDVDEIAAKINESARERIEEESG